MFFRKRKTPHWRLGIGLLALGFGLTIFAYAAAQQVVRQDASIAPARAALLAGETLSHAKPTDVVGPLVTEPGGQVYPDTYIYDEQHHPVATNIYSPSANLADAAAVPPAGAFDYAKTHGEDRFTWKPANGPRQAAVLYHNPDGKGYALAAQSLVEPERIIAHLTAMAGATLVGVIVVALAVTLL